jgi:hypothetical protein
MKKPHYFTAALIIPILFAACSSSNGLRKFKDDDLQQAPSDLAKKFEVKDADALPSPTPIPEPTPVAKKSRHHKTRHAKKENPLETPTPAPKIPPVRLKNPMPFAIGEKLEYSIRYVGVPAGYFDVEVAPFKAVGDHKVYSLKGHARTVKIFELIYRVNDAIESFWDESGLYSLRFTMDLDESKQNRKLIELYDYDKQKSFYWNRVDHVEKGYSEKKEQYDIPLWAQDPLSTLYFLRVADLPTDPAKDFRFPIIIDGKPWEASVHYLDQEKIYAGGKYFEADVYSLENYQNGELKSRGNRVWISRDEHRYVLRIEAKVKVGAFAVALDSIL